MRSFGIRLAVGLATFLGGMGLTIFWFSRHTPRAVVVTTAVIEVGDLGVELRPDNAPATQTIETPEEKAVRLAEEFVARNGYTDLPPDKNNLSYENIEWSDNTDEMLKLRHDTLERKAYGVRYSGKMGGPGWTVAFRHKHRYGDVYDETGRIVTMDKNFENLLLEHKVFPLGNVHKKF